MNTLARTGRIAIALIAAMAIGLTTRAQQPQRPTFTTSVNVVDVDVTVKDAQGKFVTGLTAGPADVARFVPTQLGPATAGDWDPTLIFEGDPVGVMQLAVLELG